MKISGRLRRRRALMAVFVTAHTLYIPGVKIPGNGVHNVVYVATEHDSVYAFDSDALVRTPLWQRSFINPAEGVTSVPSSDAGTDDITRRLE